MLNYIGYIFSCFTGTRQNQFPQQQPPVPAKPRFFQPLTSPMSSPTGPPPPLPPPPKSYISDSTGGHRYYSSDSAIGSPDLSGNSITMTTNDDLDELSRLDHEGPILELNDKINPGEFEN